MPRRARRRHRPRRRRRWRLGSGRTRGGSGGSRERRDDGVDRCAIRAAFTATRWSQASNRSGSRTERIRRHAVMNVSWAASRASPSSPRIAIVTRYTPSIRTRTISSNASRSPLRARSTSDRSVAGEIGSLLRRVRPFDAGQDAQVRSGVSSVRRGKRAYRVQRNRPRRRHLRSGHGRTSNKLGAAAPTWRRVKTWTPTRHSQLGTGRSSFTLPGRWLSVPGPSYRFPPPCTVLCPPRRGSRGDRPSRDSAEPGWEFPHSA